MSLYIEVMQAFAWPWLRFGGFLLMGFWPRLLLVSLFVLSFYGTQPVFAGGKTYQGSESSAHCTLWSNQRLKWPQTILGREKAECRRRAVDSSASNTQCRLLRTYIDGETGDRICIYKRQGRGLEDMTLSMSPSFSCQTDFMCKRD
jgi:hypothetical protein